MRDLFTCKICGDIHHNTSLLVADHIKPHKGNIDLFFDEANVRCICKRCHDGAKQSEDRTGIAVERGIDATGRPTHANHPWNRV